MGFRNPATTATAIDTGHGLANAGVRLYQDTSGPVPRGIAEWRTGLMDRNATATLSGGASGGSSFRIDGGAAVGTDAPALNLGVASLPLGGYGPSANLEKVGTLGLPDDPGWTAYACAQHTLGSASSDPAGVLVARYKSFGTRTDFQIWHRPGTGYNGGNGGYFYDLPWLSVNRTVSGTSEQFVLCRGFTSDGSQWVGWGYIPAAATTVSPYLPRSASDCRLANAQDAATGTSTISSAIPNITSNYPFLANSSSIFIGGTYETATPHT